MSTQAPQFHRIVVEDVIKMIREDFINEGVDEQVLEDLKQLWESKLVQAGVYDFPQVATHNYAYDTLTNYNYLDTSHAQPTGLMPMGGAPQNTLFMNAYLGAQTHTTARGGNTAAHHAALSALRQLNPTPTTLSSTTTTNYSYEAANSSGKPQQYLAPPPSSVVNWNTQPVPGIHTQYNPPNIKQNDGANDEKDSERLKIDAILLKKFAKVQKLKNQKSKPKKSTTTTTSTTDSLSSTINSSHSSSDSKIPQFDGLGDKKGHDDDDDEDDEEGSTKGDEELGSDLDDEDDDEEPDTEHIVLCQYEKVTRVKNKRKANLKDGIMHINGKDYVFSKATGEFDW